MCSCGVDIKIVRYMRSISSTSTVTKKINLCYINRLEMLFQFWSWYAEPKFILSLLQFVYISWSMKYRYPKSAPGTVFWCRLFSVQCFVDCFCPCVRFLVAIVLFVLLRLWHLINTLVSWNLSCPLFFWLWFHLSFDLMFKIWWLCYLQTCLLTVTP